MANEKFTQLPTVTNSNMADIIAAVQAGVSSQETLQQVFTLFLANVVLHNAGDPNGSVAGVVYQFCWDTSNNVLYTCTTSGNAATAVWTTAGSVTFPIGVTMGGTGLTSTTINQLLYSSSNNVIAGLATVNNAALTTNATGIPTWRALTDGQIIIGSTAGAPLAATLIAGAGISIANAANSITISGTGSGIGWNEVTGTSQAMTADTAYVANNGGLVTLTLPALAAFGTAIVVLGKGAGGWSIAQNAGQNIQVGSVSSTIGAGGSVSSTNRYDSISLICITANTTWSIYGAPQGALTIV